jgi:hypothetical protein
MCDGSILLLCDKESTEFGLNKTVARSKLHWESFLGRNFHDQLPEALNEAESKNLHEEFRS